MMAELVWFGLEAGLSNTKDLIMAYQTRMFTFSIDALCHVINDGSPCDD